jgi:hypothetical protein
MSGVHSQPSGAAFDLVLLMHVGCVVAGLATASTAAATANRLRRVLAEHGHVPDSVRRYFRPGVNWAGRALWGIPVFGFALLAMSQGAYDWRQGWVLGGLAIFTAVALLGEGVLWPTERRVQATLHTEGTADDHDGAVSLTAIGTDIQLMARSATAMVVLLLLGIVLMIAQP